MTPVPEVRREATNLPVKARPKMKITKVAPAGSSALARAAASAKFKSAGAFSNPANSSKNGYPYPDRSSKPKPKSYYVSKAEARRSRGGADIPQVQRYGKVTRLVS